MLSNSTLAKADETVVDASFVKPTEGGGVYGFGSTLNSNGNYYGYDSESIFTADYLLNKIQILDGGGSNIDSGTFTLYGVTK